VETCPYCGAAQPVRQTAVAAQGWQAPGNSNKAIASLVCGVLFMCAPASIAAIVLGHLALVDIKRAAGRMSGKGMAIAGLVLGYSGIGLTTLYFAFVFFLVRNTFNHDVPANESAAIVTLQNYQAALETYAKKCDAQGYPATLSRLGPGRGDCTGANLIHDRRLVAAAPVAKGYTFEYRPGVNGTDRVSFFVLVARPLIPGSTGKRFFYLDESGVMRAANSQNVGPNSPPVGTSGPDHDQAQDPPGGSQPRRQEGDP
jgi:Domain of unknown function (DUF4190)